MFQWCFETLSEVHVLGGAKRIKKLTWIFFSVCLLPFSFGTNLRLIQTSITDIFKFALKLL